MNFFLNRTGMFLNKSMLGRTTTTPTQDCKRNTVAKDFIEWMEIQRRVTESWKTADTKYKILMRIISN